MKLELQAELFRRYPKIFRKPGMRLIFPSTGDAYLHVGAAPIDERGIECGDGWFDIVDRLSCACEKEIEAQIRQGIAKECWPRVAQIKQKLGTMRFYIHGPLSDGLWEQISREHSNGGESARTCERCGAPRKPHNGSLLNTYCDNCDAEYVAGRDASAATSLDDFERRRSMVLGVLALRAE
jgi:hypothetical protein